MAEEEDFDDPPGPAGGLAVILTQSQIATNVSFQKTGAQVRETDRRMRETDARIRELGEKTDERIGKAGIVHHHEAAIPVGNRAQASTWVAVRTNGRRRGFPLR
jgi:hypothetical protein